VASGVLVASVLAFAGGCLVAAQAPINASLARFLGSPLLAATVSFAAGLVALLVVAAFTLRHVDPAWRDTPIWLFAAGGCLGALFVTLIVVLTPQLGAARLMALIVAGQLTAGLVMDHFGLFDLAVREVSMGRLAGVALVIAGAVIVTTS
jgi:transporter family-2 protein